MSVILPLHVVDNKFTLFNLFGSLKFPLYPDYLLMINGPVLVYAVFELPVDP